VFLLFCVQNADSDYDSLTVYNETFYTEHLPDDSLNSLNKLVSDIDALLTLNSKNLSSSKYGIGVYSLNQHKWYYQKNINNPLTPASTTKLYTSFLLLKLMGKSFQVATEVYHSGKIDSDGILTGNLYIKGKGDALFSTADLELLADKVRKSGIKKIIGNIYADPNFYDEKTERAIYSGDFETVQQTPPITALNIDRNAATIIVSAGNNAGSQPNVFVMPYSDSHIIINNAQIGSIVVPKVKLKGKARAKRSKAIKKRKSRGEYESPNNIKSLTPDYDGLSGDFPTMMLLSAGNGIKISTKLTPDGKQQFIVNGRIRPNTTYSYQHLLYNPSYTIAGAFKNRLKAGGITITGDIGIMPRQSDSLNKTLVYVTKFERPVFDIINTVNKDSDNYLAEILFKMIGANAGGQKDNAEKTRFLSDSLFKAMNILPIGCGLNDGSGLSRRNLVTVTSTVKLLEESYHSDFYKEFRNSLSVASVDGTLRKRFKNTKADCNICAKTGTLRNVSALAGFVKTVDGEDLVFSFIFNGPNVGAYKLLENEIGRVISEFSIKNSKTENKGN
jgi:D-alanyl-D-alanine carboxypeptidase/D-alanyl-D-alanine-endopeptidase (penicillin-binding protein 4)